MATDRPSSFDAWPVVIFAGAGIVLVALVVLLWPTGCRLDRLVVAGVESKNNLKQIGLGLHNYADGHREGFPLGTLVDDHGVALHGWEASILPYVDQAPLHRRIDFAKPWDATDNLLVFGTPVPTFRDLRYAVQTDAGGLPVSHYAANQLVLKPGAGLQFGDFTDGLSNTIIAGTVAEDPRGWGTPFNLRDPSVGLNAGPKSFGGPQGRQGYTILLFADGSAHVVRDKVSPTVVKALGTPAGGEKVDPLP